MALASSAVATPGLPAGAARVGAVGGAFMVEGAGGSSARLKARFSRRRKTLDPRNACCKALKLSPRHRFWAIISSFTEPKPGFMTLGENNNGRHPSARGMVWLPGLNAGDDACGAIASVVPAPFRGIRHDYRRRSVLPVRAAGRHRHGVARGVASRDPHL